MSIFLGVPMYDGRIEFSASVAIASRTGVKDLYVEPRVSSLLPAAFNGLWAAALNHRESGVTHFAMLHADVYPETNDWLKLLMSELEFHDADMMAAVIAIKDHRQLTSTAWGKEGEIDRYIGIADLEELPQTFSKANAPDSAKPCVLFPNTGCWVADITKPWAEKVAFKIRSGIEKTPEGHFKPWVLSEDWDFGDQLDKLGAKVMVTQKVRCLHFGKDAWPNYARPNQRNGGK